MPVPVFCCFCIPEKLVWKYSRNWTKLGQNLLFFQHEDGVQRRHGGEPRGTHTMGPRGPPLPRRGVVWGPRGSAAVALSPIYSSDAKILNTRAIIHENSRDAAAVNPSSGGFRTSFRHPAGEGNRHNSENISRTTFLKYKNNRKQELTPWHLVNRLVPENA